MNPKLTCSLRQWLHSSVGRASHRYREVTGSSPVEVLIFFQASLRNCKNCDHNCDHQRLQNTAARLIKGAKKNDHIIPILEELHWLPIRYRIQFKILLLVYKCLHGLAPQYLIELIKLRCPPRILRSSNRLVLEKPIINMASYGQRAFSYAGPDLWNTLPEHIKNFKSVNNFKKSLKTYFFHLAFK